MPKPLAPSKSLYEKLFGSEQDRFASSIKQRRMNEEIKKAGLRPFDLEEVGGMSPAMGVTKYLKAGVPNVAERALNTNIFKRHMETFGEKGKEIGERFAKKYPRIAAHMMPTATDQKGTMGVVMEDEAFNPNVFPRKAIVRLNPAYENMDQTLAHEATHVAQMLGKGDSKKAMDFYKAAEDITGYKGNPFELSAERSAKRFAGHRALAPSNMKDELYSAAFSTPAGDPRRQKLLRLLMGE